MVLLNGPPGDPHGLHVNWRAVRPGTFPYQIRQNPGPRNPLGRIKLELPNRFDVYLHDTPGKAAFNAPVRALSHGCVRVEQILPLASYALKADVSAMQQITEDALAHGATVATGGKRIGDKGNFFEPTVLVDAPLDSQVFNLEPFGPMAAIRRVASLDEAIAEANRLPFGLAAYAFTSSLRNAQQLTQQLQTGMLWINQPSPAWPEMPFGGVKDSGYGSEGGPEALEAYLNTKSVSTLNL